MCAGVSKSGSPIANEMMSRPSARSAFTRARTSKAFSVPSWLWREPIFMREELLLRRSAAGLERILPDGAPDRGAVEARLLHHLVRLPGRRVPPVAEGVQAPRPPALRRDPAVERRE